MDEEESEALAAYLDRLAGSGEDLVASLLIETELRRLATRQSVPQAAVTEVLARISLISPTPSLFYEAGILPGGALRSLDALHLATALRVEATRLVAYDLRLCAAATDLGLRVVSPA